MLGGRFARNVAAFARFPTASPSPPAAARLLGIAGRIIGVRRFRHSHRLALGIRLPRMLVRGRILFLVYLFFVFNIVVFFLGGGCSGLCTCSPFSMT
jgi:hypothetical protein